MVDLILNESLWLPTALVLSLAAAATAIVRARSRADPARDRIRLGMNLFYGCLIGVLAFGHLLAVGVKAAHGNLEGSLGLLLVMGVVLAAPSLWLTWKVLRSMRNEAQPAGTIGPNIWMGVSLLALGVHNFPLAVPAVLNVAYQLHRRPAVGWTIVTVTVIGILLLFTGSLVFLASGATSFEEFQRM